MRISDWSSDVCSSDLLLFLHGRQIAHEGIKIRTQFRQWHAHFFRQIHRHQIGIERFIIGRDIAHADLTIERADDDQCHAQPNHYVIVIEVFRLTPDRRFPNCRSEEHTSELQSLMRISYAVFCLKKKKKQNNTTSSPK